MGGKYEAIEPNKVRITFELSPESFEKGCQEAYLKNRGKINIPGFRKGRAPRKIIEFNFGKDVFYEDAVNIALPEAYEAVIKELNLDTVSMPQIKIGEISKDNAVTLIAEVYIKPEIAVEREVYTGIEYEMPDNSVTDEEVEASINSVRWQNARVLTVTDRPAQMGDKVTIDFEGFVDGVSFEGGKGEDYELVLGSNRFIDTFEEQIAGHNVGDAFLVSVTFPENYGKEELNGKPAAFNVTLKEIKVSELPEVDDEFAQDVAGLDTLEEYKESIRNKLQGDKEEQAKNKKEVDIIENLCNKVEADIPEPMIESQTDQMMKDFAGNLRRQGLNMEMYLDYMGLDMDQLREKYWEEARNQVKTRLILEAIAKKEAFEITDEELEEEITRMSDVYGMDREKLAKVMDQESREGLVIDLQVKKAVEFVIENAIPR